MKKLIRGDGENQPSSDAAISTAWRIACRAAAGFRLPRHRRSGQSRPPLLSAPGNRSIPWKNRQTYCPPSQKPTRHRSALRRFCEFKQDPLGCSRVASCKAITQTRQIIAHGTQLHQRDFAANRGQAMPRLLPDVRRPFSRQADHLSWLEVTCKFRGLLRVLAGDGHCQSEANSLLALGTVWHRFEECSTFVKDFVGLRVVADRPKLASELAKPKRARADVLCRRD